ncbi:MAG: hypothetical protein LJE94_18445 [Deltaproteobacteria bacterium]|nr:hypothetical protein [Deltaproteobacteria bacterium]
MGRIAYFYLEPLSFFEFALALGKEPLYEKMISTTPQVPLPPSLHVRTMALYRQYCLVEEMRVKTTRGQLVRYRLLSIPLYPAGNLTALLSRYL